MRVDDEDRRQPRSSIYGAETVTNSAMVTFVSRNYVNIKIKIGNHLKQLHYVMQRNQNAIEFIAGYFCLTQNAGNMR